MSSSRSNFISLFIFDFTGVFQITPALSTEVSGSGENDTSSINKVIKAVVTQEYAIE